MDEGECPVCYEKFDTDFIRCETCSHCLCLNCLVSLRSAVCPFCRQTFPNLDIRELSYSSSSSLGSHGHDQFTTLNSDWNMSRIVRHQTKRLHKRQEDEAQRARNAQLSRTHNHHANTERKSKHKYSKQSLQFEIEE